MFWNLKRKLTAMKKVNRNFLGIVTVLVSFIALGYSGLSQNLMITGDVSYFLNSNRLYDILRREAKLSRLARKYKGLHQDSFDEIRTQDIFYYYAANDSEKTGYAKITYIG